MTLELAYDFVDPLYDGSTNGVQPSAAGWPLSLGGRGYMIDDRDRGRWRRYTAPASRQQFGTDGEAGENTLNPDAGWRRSSTSWHLGAGQVDRDSGDSRRFRASKGVDVWTEGQLTLLADTTRLHNRSGTLPRMVTAGAYVYFLDGQSVRRTDLSGADTLCTGTPAATAVSITSSGQNVYIAYGASDIYRIASAGTVAASYVAHDATLVGYAKSRLLAANGAELADISTGAWPGAAYFTHADTGFEWKAIAEGLAHIYAAGTAGNKSTIYRIAVVADGSTLAAPVVAGRLPDGETIVTMFGYLSTLFIGTTQGVRVAAQSSNGDLTIGGLIPCGQVNQFAGWGRFVWFSWTNYDATSTGVGRLDLGSLTDVENLVFAYASDLMAATQGAVEGVAVLNGTVGFGVSGSGVWVPSTSKVASGQVFSGRINYAVTTEKIAVRTEVSAVGPGTSTLTAAADGAATYSAIPSSGLRGTRFETALTLTRGSPSTSTPTVDHATLIAQPTAPSVEYIEVPFIFAPNIDIYGRSAEFDSAAAYDDIREFWQTQAVVTYAAPGETDQVTVDRFEWNPINPADVSDPDASLWCGTMLVKLKVVA